MKRKLNWTKVALLLVSLACLVNAIADCQQEKKIEELSSLIEKVDIPIEKKEGYWVELSEIPEELLEREVIHE